MKTLKTTQRVKIGPITAADSLGNPAPVENVTVESLLGEGILARTDDPDNEDPTVMFLTPTGIAGKETFRVMGDAQIGEGEATITLDLDFEVTSPLASALNVPQEIQDIPVVVPDPIKIDPEIDPNA